MGANAGPDIVSDGLVLALDAADNNSFRGEPTTNTFSSTNDLNASPWIKEGAVSISPNSATAPDGTQTANTVTYASTGNLYFYQTDRFTGAGGFLQGQTYTISIWAKGAVGGESFILAFQRRGDGTNTYSTTKTLTTEWKRYTYTKTLPSDGAHNSLWGLFRSTLNTTLYVWNPQIEQKSYATRFTTGTRGTTVATGGGWADISGNSNHGEILNGTTTSNDGSVLGALDFDGTDDYVAISNLGLSSHTIQGWFYSNDGSQGGASFATIVNIFGNYDGGSSKYALIGLVPTLTFRIDDGSTSFANIVTINYSANIWYHVALTYNADGDTRAYVNGNQVGSRTSTTNIIFDSIPFNVAKSQANVHFNGLVAGVSAYSRALTAGEVLQNYNATKTRFGL